MIISQKNSLFRTDYLLAVKGNQGVLREWAEICIKQTKRIERPYQLRTRSHGREVHYSVWATAELPEIVREQWPGAQMLGAVASLRTLKGKTQPETRYYISSRRLNPEPLLRATQAHWGIENQLHWMLDVCFDEDLSRVRKDHAPQNLSLLKKIVMNLIRQDRSTPTKAFSHKRKHAAWDDEGRAAILGLRPRVD